eukprot:14836506-Ditylum_brightwellii.AAC.1
MSDVQQQQEALQEEFQSLLENPAILQLIEFGIKGVKSYIDIDISILIVTQLLLDGNFILPTLKFFSPK